MSKYIVEIKPEYEDSFKGLMILGAKDSNLFVDALAVEDIEELNSDYINEHFGDLQDTAYQRGLEDGKQTAIGAAELREKLEYQKGFEDGKAQSENGCVGCMWEGNPYDACEQCSNAYKNLWTAKQKTDEIKVGDEVEHTVSGYTSKAIFLEKNKDDEDWYKCLFWTGCGVAILSYPKSQFKRTGRHFGIDKILEEMRDDSNN